MTTDYKQEFLSAVPGHGFAIHYRTESPATEAFRFTRFTAAIRPERIEAVAKHLLALGLLMAAVTIAELAAEHEHRDEIGAALSPEECDEHRAAFTDLRRAYLQELYHDGVEIDLEAYSADKLKEILPAGDPCRLLANWIERFRGQL